jgi:hypothetical protein
MDSGVVILCPCLAPCYKGNHRRGSIEIASALSIKHSPVIPLAGRKLAVPTRLLDEDLGESSQVNCFTFSTDLVDGFINLEILSIRRLTATLT